MIGINNKDIESIQLLSVEEARNLPQWIRASGYWWWLQSPGDDSGLVAYVYDDGSVEDYGSDIDDSSGVVRPVLKIRNLDSQNLEIGETIKILGLLTQYIGHNSVLLCERIAYHRFDSVSNDYKTSEIKQFIKEWLEERKRENNV